MMKKAIFCIVILLFSVPLWAATDTLEGEELTSSATVEGVSTCDTIEGQELASGGTDCSGAIKFAWHMEDNDSTPDVTIGSPAGCSDGDEIGADDGGAATFSSAVGQSGDGTLAMLVNGNNDAYTYNQSGASWDLCNINDVKITFNLYVSTAPSTSDALIFRMWDSATNQLVMYIDDADGKLKVNHTQNGAVDTVLTPTSISTGQWLSVDYRAKAGVAGNDHYLAVTGETTDEDDDDIGTGSSDGSSLIYIGNYTTHSGTYYIDDFLIYAASGY